MWLLLENDEMYLMKISITLNDKEHKSIEQIIDELDEDYAKIGEVVENWKIIETEQINKEQTKYQIEARITGYIIGDNKQ